ncbi:hypothetical protein [Moorena sp. SIO4G3]|uniref:hypothetical protein n=1 Tax=Moorena sp. SIO4G3 TaxID=2607821 RepID=UPI00142CB9BC|nr:hypothetical protein [Moorena sp. SIO4G3]NEO78184.1 hypothetical protein [Moorena sp. SIO4G3]
MIKEMQASPYIRINHLEFEKSTIDLPDIEFAISEIEKIVGIQLEDYFRDYIFVAEEIWIAWDYKQGSNYEKGGEFRLINLFDSLVRNKAKLWNDEMSQDKIEFLKSLRPFEDHPYSGDGKIGAFRISHGNSPEIWFYDLRTGYYKLSLTYEEYIELLLETKGFFNWQYLFCDAELHHYPANLKKYLTKMIDILYQIFPSFDREKYLEILNKKNK